MTFIANRNGYDAIGILTKLSFFIFHCVFQSVKSSSPTIQQSRGTHLAHQAYPDGNRQFNVYCTNSPAFCQPLLNSSKMLNVIHDPHATEVIWIFSNLIDISPLAIDSMKIRINQRHGNIRNETHTLANFSQFELNEIDPNWKLFFVDPSDRGIGNWGFWYLEHELAPWIGWKRIHYVTRSTQNDRFMDRWVRDSRTRPSLLASFGKYVGKPINFTETLGKACASVQRLSLFVRQDVADAVDEFVHHHQPEAYRAAESDGDGGSHGVGEAVARLSRPTDVRTFWNATVCNVACAFRNHVAETVASIPLKHPSVNVNTNVVGFIHRKGRNNVSPEYIEGMLSTKIIVLAQRDHWEDHARLDEALLSGALVMTDPQLYYPHGIVDGENIVVYNSIMDMESKIQYYLNPKNEEERIQIGRRGRELALTHHRVWQHAERLLLNDMQYRNEYGIFNKPWSSAQIY